jgi:hypothetical protein
MTEKERDELSERLVSMLKEIKGADIRLQNSDIEGCRINVRLVAARLALMDNELAWHEHEQSLNRK